MTAKEKEFYSKAAGSKFSKKIGKTTAQQLADRLKFLGTTGSGTTISAMVFIPERGPGMFRPGDRVAEFVLKEIEMDSLVLELGDEQVSLKR